MSYLEALMDESTLDRIYNDEEIIQIAGKAVFTKLPSPRGRNFEFTIMGEKMYRAVIDRRIFSCHESLRDSRIYMYKGVENDGIFYVESFCDITDACGGDDNIERNDIDIMMENISYGLFKYHCENRKKAIKIHLDLSGRMSGLVVDDCIAEFDLRCKNNKYHCIMDTDMKVERNVRSFVRSLRQADDGIFYDDRLHVYEKENGREISVSGILLGERFFVFNCEYHEEKKASSLVENGTITGAMLKKIEEFPEHMQKEMLDFVAKGRKHPTKESRHGAGSESLQYLEKKYEVLKSYYPQEVQYAIEKTLREKSLKELQKTKILDVLVNTKWDAQYELNTDAGALKRGMDETHFGLEHLKNQLIKLVVSNLRKKSKKGMNLLLVGPAGVGKTSLVKRFSELHNIPFGKISLNGINTAYYLKGTPRLYDNAIVGQIMRTVREVGNNAVILLDEIDKMTEGEKECNPYTALYDLLDREELFQDEMIEVGVDLSDVVFVLTANDTTNLSPAILDRVEVIYVDDYTPSEKKRITYEYVIPRLMRQYGLDEGDIEWTEDAVEALADDYTMSGGVRDIERNVLGVIRSAIVTYNAGCGKKVIVDGENVSALLDVGECERTRTEYEIAGMKRKFRRYKKDYPPLVRDKICTLFGEYDADTGDSSGIIKKRLFSLVNLLPAGKGCEYDIGKIRKKLDETHCGMEEVKEQIMMHICARQVSKKKHTKCILLNGMCGIGKTTICKALAESLGLPFVKISLNGISSPETINGFEAGWKNAEPGVIVKSLSELGTGTAFILLDEIDKMVITGNKDPYAALLDLLDNAGGFRDSFCGVPVNLGDAFIVATSNYAENIPAAVMDRLDVIEMNGYTLPEKRIITKDYVIPKKLSQYNLSDKVSFNDTVISLIVDKYCKSYGMRDVERAVEKILCKLIMENSFNIKRIEVDEDTVVRILGAYAFEKGNVSGVDRPGVARALAVSGNCGTTFEIEVVENPYAAGDEITGLPGQSVIDSVKIAKLLVSKCMDRELPKLHIHFSEGGIKKDGPSAGITVFAAIYSYFSGISIGSDIGFTGEINVYGDVWAIGGAELKISAAENAGASRVFIPYDNYTRLKAAGKLGQYKCEIVPVKNIYDVISELFGDGRLKKII